MYIVTKCILSIILYSEDFHLHVLICAGSWPRYSRRAYNRWHLARLLLNNSSLQQFRSQKNLSLGDRQSHAVVPYRQAETMSNVSQEIDGEASLSIYINH